MDTVDNQQANGADNQGSLAQDQTQDMAQQADSSSNPSQQAGQELASAYQPFKSGKEKFKAAGKEFEWDWETAKKYASLGYNAYEKTQEASEIRKRAETAYSQLLDLARKDPEGLISALNPNYKSSSQQANPALRQDDQSVTDQDPRDLELRRLNDDVNRLKTTLESQEIEAERKAINTELDEATGKYSVLKGDKFALNYIKSEYRKALQSGMDVTIDDIAFHVAQEIQESRNQRNQQTTKRLEEKRKQAPVSVVSAASEGASKTMSLDEVKKLAGRT